MAREKYDQYGSTGFGLPASKVPGFKDKKEMADWYRSLTPEELRMHTSPVLAGLNMNHPDFSRDYRRWIKTGKLPIYALEKTQTDRAIQEMQEIDKPIFEE